MRACRALLIRVFRRILRIFRPLFALRPAASATRRARLATYLFVATVPCPATNPRLSAAMRPVVYFPELRTRDAVVPAQLAIGVDTLRPTPSVTPATDFTLSAALVRLESDSTPRTVRRRPNAPTSVIEA